jgi:hypothetical protein
MVFLCECFAKILLCQASAAGVVDLKKLEADFTKGVNNKVWAPIVAAAIKKCGPIATRKYYYIYFIPNNGFIN